MVGTARRAVPPGAPEARPARSGRVLPNNRVILWPDTFNNFFHPETAIAALEVLEHTGFHVVVPHADLCCGRPLYDYGMLDTAKRWLAQILAVLRGEIEAGTPMIGLEPSCTAVFRDELTGLFPQNEEAIRLSQQTFTFAEFFEKFTPEYRFPTLAQKALFHGHCHHKAIMKIDADRQLLERLGLDFEVLDSGCCGMAGAFGFEKDHYDVSIACAERMLLPKVRGAPRDTLIVTDGFSCREQIRQTTDRRALHIAQVVQMTMTGKASGSSENLSKRELVVA